ncbi:MAG: hypothetical protein MR938_05880 [Tenericutes bacterium]|nr:hypothetical protein [Mycoplasmatota bacterium]
MRTFYLFQIKDGVLKNYKNNYEELFTLLESIHYLKTEDIVLGFNIFDKIVTPMDKENVNDYVKKMNLSKESYICYNYTHTINDFYFDETTKMVINNSHIKIKTNKNVPSFFFNIKAFNNIFVCDFINHDYFLLEDSICSCITA